MPIGVDTAPDSKRSERGKMTHAECAMLSLPMLTASIKKRSKELRDKYAASPKKCLYCEEPLTFESKRSTFCNHACSALWAWSNGSFNGVATNGKVHPWYGKDRPCEFCQKPLKLYTNRFCSKRCAKEHRYQAFVKAWMSGNDDGRRGLDATSHYIVRYLKEKFGNKCSKCGWCEVNPYTGNVPVQLHHEDGDYRNNKEANLDLLCPNCHSLTATHGGRNKGRGRIGRRLWRGKISAGIVQLAERDLAKVEVPGS